MFSLDLRCKQEEKDLISAELWDRGCIGITELDSSEPEAWLRAYFGKGADRDALSRDFDTEPAEVDQRDWVKYAQDQLHPMRVGSRFFLVPKWRDDPAPEGRMKIVVDAGLAFGTGAHDTTRFCLELLEEHVRPGMTVVDVGTGSGILSEAAKLLGAVRVAACDIDATAVEIARENFTASRAGVSAFVGTTDAVRSGSADLAVANISPDWIARLAGEWKRVLRPGGTAILSGFQDVDMAHVSGALEKAGLLVTEHPSTSDWRAVVARNTERMG